jgi:hypothetical protein
MDENVNLTPKQVAARLHISEKTLQRQRKNGEGPPWFKVGARQVLYPLNGIEAFERAQMAFYCPKSCDNHN